MPSAGKTAPITFIYKKAGKGVDKTMLTLGQARYLLAIEKMRGRERNMSKLAEILDVSKPSVTNMITALEEKQWIKKGPPLTLTVVGKALANGITGKQSLLAGYFSKELGLAEEDISEDILILMLAVSEKFVNRLIYKIETDMTQAELGNFCDNVNLTNFQGVLQDGIYDIPFCLLKESGRELSMGDKGFVHPAKLVVIGGHGVITLRATPVKHMALRGAIMKGMLARLFYWDGSDFAEAKEKDGVYSFPVMGMYWSHDKEKNVDFGVVKIKLHASVGVVNMPDSVADLAIYLE